jgi:hypothetical protein
LGLWVHLPLENLLNPGQGSHIKTGSEEGMFEGNGIKNLEQMERRVSENMILGLLGY